MKKTNTNKNFIIGLCMVSAVIVFALAGLVFTPFDPEEMDTASKLAAPSLKHLFGCDNFGRDILSRVQQGTRMTMLIGLSSTAIGAVIGTVLGAVMGYFGGLLDEFLMRIIDVLFAIPSILLALIFISLFGTGTFNVILALGFAIVPSFAKMVRTEFMKQREMDYVQAARLMGAGKARILFVHILPNVLPTLLNCILISLNNAVLAEAGMSFLGIGVQPPQASLGRMLSEAQGYLQTAPFYTIFPGLVMIIMLLGFGLMSEGGGMGHAFRRKSKD
ncbi:MAG: ABC transporter permease [Lachnospiraceae bacterium]|nr:ABC transporter permease [Lachnospiraceae bacterium]